MHPSVPPANGCGEVRGSDPARDLDGQPLMTAAVRIADRATNERVELARYRMGGGERVIYGQRVLGVVRLVDHPAGGRGRRYVIERELTVMAELEAIVADHLQQAATSDVVRAAGSCPLIAEMQEPRR